ncbi:CWF19-like protein 2 [Capsicum galapagoense]
MSILSGLKFIPREHVEKEKDESLDDSRKQRRKSGHKKERERKKKIKSRSTSSDDEDLDKIRARSKKKKWYASDEDLSSYSDESGSEDASDYERKSSSRKRSKKRRNKDGKSKERSRSSSPESESEKMKKNKKNRQSHSKGDELPDNLLDNGFDGSESRNDHELVRREMGLDWMLRPKDNVDKIPESVSNCSAEETPAEEVTKVNPRELNPYLKDGGSGYPDDEGTRSGGSQLLSTAVVGDGGASWRLKALRRAQEQADREGRKLDEVAAERWGSLSRLAISVSSGKAAPTRAHLHAIKDRRQGVMDDKEALSDKRNQTYSRKETSPGRSKMRMPTNLKDSLSWRKEKNNTISNADAGLIATAISSVNKFSNDGNFMREFMLEKSGDSSHAPDSSNLKPGILELKPDLPVYEKTSEDATNIKPALTANQLAAKVMQLRMKGMHDEAEKLLKEAEEMKIKQTANDVSSRPRIDGSTSRYVMHDLSARQKNKMEDADVHLAQKIVQNKKYTTYGQADDEYDYDGGPRKKSRKKGGGENQKSLETANHARRILTQQERCQFCFENPTRPKHLVVAIANFSYLSLPVWRPIAPGHCCILTMQHESATRSLDDNVWEEFRNFKKCLIMVFAKQEKDLVFLETVMSLGRQKRHCLVECIPLPKDVAKQAPLYFKKAIDEAEDEWSQHNAKKLIDTSVKGLRASIPKDFPYFHVEFGLNKGFVHVIDDEKQFSSSFGLNVIRGMLKLPAEDMHQRQRRESVDTQREAVASFARQWEPFDWTKQL